jgi:hypothetical protein
MAPDPELDPTLHTLNTRALVGLVVSVGVGIAGLFVLPLLQSTFGLGFGAAFGLVLAVEFVAFLGVAASVLRLYRERTFE